MSTCNRMRTAVLFSALLLSLGLLLAVLAQGVPFVATLAQIALFLVLAAVLVLAVTFLTSLIPRTAERLRECSH